VSLAEQVVATIEALLYASSVLVGSLVAMALLCNNITDVVEGSLLYINKLSSISISVVKDFQLALFLKNLEALFF
jgi:hypothetical protein